MLPVMASLIPLERVLVNLLSNSMNALDRMDKEDKWVNISTRTVKDKCVIEVLDNGPGIPDEIIDHIFDPLFIADENSQGMGLGLAIVKHLLEEIGGTIKARTLKTGGALFRIKLPLI